MKRKSAMIIAVAAAALSGAIILFASFPPIGVLRRGSARLLLPVMRLADGVRGAIGSGGRVLPLGTCGACDDERIARAVAEAKIVQATEENESLKKMLGLKQQFSPSLTSARVMLYNQEWDREWLVIDVGEQDGVAVGDTVIDEYQFLVGEIAEVNVGSATVTIASDKGTAFSVAFVPSGGPSQQGSPAGGEALAHGLGGRAFGIELIPRDTPVSPGDMVVRTSKSNKKIPLIFAGRIVGVDDRAGGAFKIGKAVLLSHPERINRVMVVDSL